MTHARYNTVGLAFLALGMTALVSLWTGTLALGCLLIVAGLIMLVVDD